MHAQHNQWRNGGQSKEETKVRQEPIQNLKTQKRRAIYRHATLTKKKSQSPAIVPFLCLSNLRLPLLSATDGSRSPLIVLCLCLVSVPLVSVALSHALLSLYLVFLRLIVSRLLPVCVLHLCVCVLS